MQTPNFCCCSTRRQPTGRNFLNSCTFPTRSSATSRTPKQVTVYFAWAAALCRLSISSQGIRSCIGWLQPHRERQDNCVPSWDKNKSHRETNFQNGNKSHGETQKRLSQNPLYRSLFYLPEKPVSSNISSRSALLTNSLIFHGASWSYPTKRDAPLKPSSKFRQFCLSALAKSDKT